MIGTASDARIALSRRSLPGLLQRVGTRRYELWALALLVGANTGARAALGLWRTSLVYFPDEYLYSALARSVSVSGVPHVRGASAHFPAILGPYLMSPPWLIHDPQIAYRVALGWGSLWFSLAALPAFALARRVGVSGRGALLVAAAALLLPDGVYTTMLLSEPFAYPLFLATSLAAVSAIAEPSRRRQLVLVVLMAALTLIRLQFVVIPIVYLGAAALAESRLRIGALLRTQRIVVLCLAIAVGVVMVAGFARVAGVYAGVGTWHLSWTVLLWVVVNIFVLLLASGWVVAPPAAVGLAELLRGDRARRGFAVFALLATAAFVLEAALFGEREGVLVERYTFYVAPFLMIAFAAAPPSRFRSRTFVAVGYSLAATALLIPVLTPFATAVADQAEAPTLFAVDAITGGSAAARSFIAAGCALAAAAIALGIGGRKATAAVSLACLTALSVACTMGMLTAQQRSTRALEVRTYAAPVGSALLATRATTPIRIMTTLFWNPNVTRVLVLGGGGASDGYASTSVRLGAGGLVAGDGDPVGAPLVLGPDGTGLTVGGGVSPHVLRSVPTVLVFGWSRANGYLDSTSFLYVSARRQAVDLLIRLRSDHGDKRVSFACTRLRRVVSVSLRPESVRLSVPAGSLESCRISLIGGAAEKLGVRVVGVRAAIRAVTPRGGVSTRVSARLPAKSPAPPGS